jgi:hypothetical protein
VGDTYYFHNYGYDVDNGTPRTVTDGGGRPSISVNIGRSLPANARITGYYVVGGDYDSFSWSGNTVTISGPGYVAMRGGEPRSGGPTAYWYASWGSGNWPGGMGGHVSWAYNAPGTPSLQAAERTSNGTSLRVNVNSGSGRVTYNRVSLDNTNWYENNTTFTGLSPTTQYTVYGYSANEDAGSASVNLGTVAGVPNAPSSISYSNVGRNYTVALGASSSDNGSAISSYTIQYRTSTDGGTTWTGYTNAQTATWNPATSKFEYTYSLLTPALTYQFRAYATNAIGTSTVIESSTKFVSAGGRRKISGGTFEPTQTAKRYNAATNQWVDITIAKRYNGATSQWVDLT